MASLAVKYRPKTLDEIVGQECVVQILKRQLETNEVKNSYLFVGRSGAGKTSIARALATAINGGVGAPIEIDAASNSGVDNIRTIIESSNARAVDSEYKIFIIDEVQGLSNAAWQALLKTLEEPNPKSIFMLCTTEVQKIPLTILNRVQRFDIHNISQMDIQNRLEYICKQENITFEQDALVYISKLSKGGLRDAITMMDKVACISNDITLNSCIKALGAISYDIMIKLTNAIIDRKEDIALQLIEEEYTKGKDLKLFIEQYTAFILDVSKYILFKNFNNLDIPSTYEKELNYLIKLKDVDKFYLDVLKTLAKLKGTIRYSQDIRCDLEMCILFLCR